MPDVIGLLVDGGGLVSCFASSRSNARAASKHEENIGDLSKRHEDPFFNTLGMALLLNFAGSFSPLFWRVVLPALWIVVYAWLWLTRLFHLFLIG